jgi:pimeloyl-ACP methyl ester carboxylesterase
MSAFTLGIASFLMITAPAYSRGITAGPSATEACRIELEGVVSGRGPHHVVLIGGLTASPNEWRQTREHLEADYIVHVVSIPGLGGVPSHGKGCDADIQDLADGLGSYIAEKAAPGKTILVGHSAGGLASLQLAGTKGNLLSGIVVVDALPFMAANFGSDSVDDALQRRIHDEYRQMRAESQPKFLDRLRLQLQASMQDPFVASSIADVAADSERSTYASLYASTMLTDLRGIRFPTALPTFVLFADQASNGAPPGFLRRRYKAQYSWLGDDHLIEVPSARHYVMLDQPTAFIKSLQQALRSILAEKQGQ